MKNKNIVVILVLMLLALIFVMPVSARSSIPIELALTAEPSTITVGGTSTLTVRLLSEDGESVVTEADIHVNLSATLGYVNSSMVIPAGTNLSSTEFTSKVSGIAVLSAGSRGLINDAVSIAVVSTAMPSPSSDAEQTAKKKAPGFEAIFAIVGLFTVTYLLRR